MSDHACHVAHLDALRIERPAQHGCNVLDADERVLDTGGLGGDEDSRAAQQLQVCPAPQRRAGQVPVQQLHCQAVRLALAVECKRDLEGVR